MNIDLPKEAEYIINKLEENGYEAYAVGGCVRDSLLGNVPKDWDICTSALPEQTMGVFSGGHIIETGLKHGTVTLMVDRSPFEITTYRKDGIYSDNRRPDTVEFVGNLKEDLARRDFTINAMAYNKTAGLVDYFGGTDDLNNRIVRCVGDPGERFREDALRIMRALRFASVLGFSISESTAEAMFANRKLLKNIAVERIADELNKFLLGDDIIETVTESPPVLFEIIPELAQTAGHIFKSVDYAPKESSMRLTMLLREAGADTAREILTRLKYDNETIGRVVQLILHHDDELHPERKAVKRFMNRLGEERLRELIAVQRADARAQAEGPHEGKLENLIKVERLIDEIIERQQCFSLKDLAVNGRDLIGIGIPEGAEVGVILNRLLDMVINETVLNDRAELLETAKKV